VTNAAATASSASPATPATPTASATAPAVVNGFSPGGLAFIRDGNLWVTGNVGTPQRAVGETQVTSGGGLSYPRWSPTGRFLLVAGFDKAWLLFAKGDLEPLDDCRAPTWSPAADRLACIAPTGDLVALNVEPGSGPAKVLVPAPPDGSLTFSPAAWSPDGRSLAFVSAPNSPDRLAPYDLRVVDAATASTRTVATLQGQFLGPVWSGNYLYFQLNPSLSASILADGAEGYALDMRTGHTTDLGWRLGYPDTIAPRPGEDEVALIAGGGRQAWTGKSLAIDSLPGSNSQWPGTVPGVPASPAWSADGARIAYVSAPDAPAVSGGDLAKAALARRRIYVQDANGAQPPTVLADQPDYRDEHPQFDGAGSILFARIGSDGVPALWLWDAQESGLLRHMTGPIDWPAEDTGWFGYYGHITWEAVYDWYPAHHYQPGGE
jgi:hypothetical protein